jgi:hypothetical protein
MIYFKQNMNKLSNNTGKCTKYSNRQSYSFKKQSVDLTDGKQALEILEISFI